MRLFSLLIPGLLAITQPAKAAIITVDIGGVFGAATPMSQPLAVPAGTPFSIRFTYDSNAPGVPDPLGTLSRYSFASGASVTIGGTTTNSAFSLEAVNINGSGLLVGLFDLGAGPNAGEIRGLTLVSDFAANAITNQDLPADPAFFTQYGFSAQVYDLLANPAANQDPLVAISFTDGPLTRSASAAAVPEGPTWLMMIGGFALAGGALRRQRRRRCGVSHLTGTPC